MSFWRFDRGCNVSAAHWGRYLTAGRVAAVCLALLVLWFMRPFVFGGEVLFKRDIHLFFVPQAEAFVRIIHAGSWPIWNPYISFGQPYLANTSSQIFYPTTWLNLIMQPWTNYTVFATVHLFFSGLGLYFLAIRLGISRVGSIVAAALWTASGPHLSFVDLWHHFTGVSWMPWIFLAADTAMEKATVRHTLLLGLALAAQIFAGSADLVAITGLATGIWIGVRHVRWRKGFRANSRLLGLASLAAVVGLGLSAILWLPTLDVASRTARWGLPDAIRTYWSVHPASLIEILVPDLWSSMPSSQVKAILFDSREPFLQSLYLGLPSLGLVIAAAWSQRRLIRNLLVALLVLTLLVSLGRHGVFYDTLVRVLPPLQILRYPVKAMILAAFSWSLLAGLGFDVLRKLEVPANRWGLKTKVALILLVVAWFSVGGSAVFLWVIGLRDLSFD